MGLQFESSRNELVKAAGATIDIKETITLGAMKVVVVHRCNACELIAITLPGY